MNKDLRIIKTERAIYEAFIKLLKEKGFSSLTVQDIVNEALINRKTFYVHYQDKYDLAEQIGNSFLKEFDLILEKRISSIEGENKGVSSFIDGVYSELYGNKKNILAIWEIKTDRLDVKKEVSTRLENIYMKLSKAYKIEGDNDLQAHMFSSFVMSSYSYIMREDKPYASHQLLKEYKHLYEVIEKAVKE